ncbi:hypothetical protein A0O34_07235 [Chryseobacterium glaciei]|uniref:Uncharacterized protein n=1 Tax=Chryseobacterium glaciei TaxID=1685010 RepID=A0A172XTW2_9FLAO|nr:hypothetical protein [Chryseobacterium glaciei]ANF50320.1 hypothetical protein A0O34_07235 [Chryseobacterium glaciei]
MTQLLNDLRKDNINKSFMINFMRDFNFYQQLEIYLDLDNLFLKVEILNPIKTTNKMLYYSNAVSLGV